MLQLYEIRDWLKTLSVKFDHYYIGKLDQKQDKSLGVYSLARSGSPISALGEDSTYLVKQVSLLIHYNNSQKDTEAIACQLFEELMQTKPFKLNNFEIRFLGMLVPEPQLIGTDDKGIYEAVIEFQLIYERSI